MDKSTRLAIKFAVLVIGGYAAIALALVLGMFGM